MSNYRRSRPLPNPPGERELPWTAPEAFALIPDTTLDGDRVEREKRQCGKDREEADKQQNQFKLRAGDGS